MVESMTNRRDRGSICDPLTLCGLHSGFNWPTVWFLWPTEILGDNGLCINNDPLASNTIYYYNKSQIAPHESLSGSSANLKHIVKKKMMRIRKEIEKECHPLSKQTGFSYHSSA